MKLGITRAHRFESGPNMTPLVDVVMVILIFLMLVGTFASGEWFLQQNTGLFDASSRASSAPPPPGYVPDEPIVIRVSEPSPDRFLAVADVISTSDKDDLAAKLLALRRRLEKIGKSVDKMPVYIQPQATVRHRHYMAVYEAALAAGFTKVSFAVTS